MPLFPVTWTAQGSVTLLLLIAALPVAVIYLALRGIGLATTQGETRKEWERNFKQHGFATSAAIALLIHLIGSLIALFTYADPLLLGGLALLLFGCLMLLAQSTGGARTIGRYWALPTSPVTDRALLTNREIVRGCFFVLLLILGVIVEMLLIAAILARSA